MSDNFCQKTIKKNLKKQDNLEQQLKAIKIQKEIDRINQEVDPLKVEIDKLRQLIEIKQLKTMLIDEQEVDPLQDLRQEKERLAINKEIKAIKSEIERPPDIKQGNLWIILFILILFASYI